MLEADRSIADHGLNLREIARIFRERYTKWAATWVQEGLAASEGAGMLIGVSNSTLLAKGAVRSAGIPFAIARLQPMTLSRELPPVMFEHFAAYCSCLACEPGAFYLIFQMVWGVMSPAINGIVRPQLGLPPYP